MATQTGAAATLWVEMRLLLIVYTSVPRVMTPRQAACTAPTIPWSANKERTSSNSCLPASPPRAAPRARGVPVRRSTPLSPLASERVTE